MLQDQRPLAQGGMPCLLAPSFCTTPSPPSAGCLPWGLPTRPHARGTVSSKIQCSGAREEADGVRWGQLLLQIPQGCWAWSCHDCAGALRLVRDTRPSDRPATTTRTMTTLGRYLVTSLEIYRRHPRDGVIAIVPMRKLSLRSDHLLVAPQPDSLTADSSQASSHACLSASEGPSNARPMSRPHVAILLYPRPRRGPGPASPSCPRRMRCAWMHVALAIARVASIHLAGLGCLLHPHRQYLAHRVSQMC